MNGYLLSRKTDRKINVSRLLLLFPSQWNKIPVIATATTLSLITISTISPVWAQERGQTRMPMRTITATGKGIETIPTTLSQVRLGVEVQGKTAPEVQQEAAKRSSAVVSLLKSRNVEKLETTGISLNPVYSYNNNTQKLTGYTATNTVSFRLPTEQAGTVIDAAVKAGATRIDGISFTASDKAIAAARQQALQTATQDAQQQAYTVLSTLNLAPKEVVTIQVNGAAPPQPPMPLAAQETAKFADRSALTPVVGGEQQVEASVTLQISY